MSSLAIHYSVLVVKAELDQMLCGLSDTLDVLTLLRQNASTMRPLLVCGSPPLPTANSVYDLFRVNFSPTGSNVRKYEETTVMLWNDFLQKVEGET